MDNKTKIAKDARKRIHISEIFRFENDDEPEDLLPEDIYSTYWQDPERQMDFSFKIKGPAKNRTQILKVLQANLDVFSQTLSTTPAK